MGNFMALAHITEPIFNAKRGTSRSALVSSTFH
jgi:hypothetical protein